jgi:hypothetical protein
MLEVDLEEKRREIIKERINYGRSEDLNSKQRILLGIRRCWGILENL